MSRPLAVLETLLGPVVVIVACLPGCGGAILSESSADGGADAGDRDAPRALDEGLDRDSGSTTPDGSAREGDSSDLDVANDGPTVVTVVADGLTTPNDIAVTATTLYCVEGVKVVSLPLAGGRRPTVLATRQKTPLAVAVDDVSVYWVTRGTPGGLGAVEKAPLGGGDVTTLASGREPLDLVVEGGSVYWTDSLGAIMKMSRDGGTPTTLASGLQNPWNLAVDAKSLYFTDHTQGTVSKVSRDGGEVKVLARAQNQPQGIAVDATSVYWVSSGSGEVMKAPTDGGALVTLATGQNSPQDVAVDATHLYWTNAYGGTVMKLPIGGGKPSVFAKGGGPGAIVVDSTSVYFTDWEPGDVKRVTPK